MENNKSTQNKKNNKKGRKIKLSLLTVVLIICIVELFYGAAQNINKLISFNSKIKNLEEKRNEELNRNKQLKSEVKNFDSDMTLEAIARNNLKMASDDEVLIIINKPEKPQADSEDSKEKQKKNRR